MWISQRRRIKTDGGVDRLWHPAAEPRRTTQRLMITLNQSFGALSQVLQPRRVCLLYVSMPTVARRETGNVLSHDWGMDPLVLILDVLDWRPSTQR